MWKQDAKRTLFAVVIAASASGGCYARAHARHLAAGNVGCPSRTGPVLQDLLGLGISSAAAAAPAYTDETAALVGLTTVGGVSALIFTLSLLQAATVDCNPSAAEIELAAETKRCNDGDPAACLAIGARADQHSLSDPAAAMTADWMFARACELGEAKACRLQGERRRLGQPDEAARFFARACSLGDQNSCQGGGRRADAQRSGTCFFVAAGVAITNHHVVEGGGTLTILDSQGRMLAATVQRSSAEADLAVLAVPTATGIPPLPLGADAGLGAHVFTIGFPFPSVLGFDPKFAEGAVGGVSGLGSRDLYQVTVPVQPGNSGGPLVDDRGTIVGVIVAKLDAEKVKAVTGATPENVNFAIKASVLAKVLSDAAVTPSTGSGTSGDAVARVSASVCQVLVEPTNATGRAPGMVGRE